MDDVQKNWFMVGWPVVTAVVGMVYMAGSANQEVLQIQKDVEDITPLVARVAVLEAGADQTKEDLQEIKADVKLIRDYLLEKGK
jgi:outer membrane murein-binding lipoprotein Lpp